MAKQVIGIGATANDGTGDPLRTAMDKTNQNFTELYGKLPLALAANKDGVDQTGIVNETFTKITFPNVVVDDGGDFTASRYTPPAGKVLVAASIAPNGNNMAVGSLVYCSVYKNGSRFRESILAAPVAGKALSAGVSFSDTCSGTDYYEVFTYIDGGTGDKTISGFHALTFFTATAFPN